MSTTDIQGNENKSNNKIKLLAFQIGKNVRSCQCPVRMRLQGKQYSHIPFLKSSDESGNFCNFGNKSGYINEVCMSLDLTPHFWEIISQKIFTSV